MQTSARKPPGRATLVRSFSLPFYTFSLSLSRRALSPFLCGRQRLHLRRRGGQELDGVLFAGEDGALGFLRSTGFMPFNLVSS